MNFSVGDNNLFAIIFPKSGMVDGTTNKRDDASPPMFHQYKPRAIWPSQAAEASHVLHGVFQSTLEIYFCGEISLL